MHGEILPDSSWLVSRRIEIKLVEVFLGKEALLLLIEAIENINNAVILGLTIVIYKQMKPSDGRGIHVQE